MFQGTLLALASFRCRCQNNGVSLAGLKWHLRLRRCYRCRRRQLGTFLFCRQLGTLLVPALHRVLGKMRPGFWPNSGSHFPDGVGCGKCDPEYCSETGCGFPDAPQTESASHSGAPKRDALSARKNCRSCVKQCRSLLAQHQRRELCLGVHHVVGAGGFQLCAAAEAPADARALKAGVVAGQDIDIGIAHIERGRRIGA